MLLGYLLRGFLIGFAIAAPVGPIGVLVIRRTLVHGRGIGLASGLGAATADTLYGLIAALGLTAVSRILVSESTWIRVFGGAFLLYMGLTVLLARPAEAATAGGAGRWGSYVSTVMLTLTNPSTILSFAAVFAGLGLGTTRGDYGGALLVVLGVFCGSAAWWLMLSGLVSLARERISGGGLVWINRLSGGILTLFGASSMVTAAASLRRSLAR